MLFRSQWCAGAVSCVAFAQASDPPQETPQAPAASAPSAEAAAETGKYSLQEPGPGRGTDPLDHETPAQTRARSQYEESRTIVLIMVALGAGLIGGIGGGVIGFFVALEAPALFGFFHVLFYPLLYAALVGLPTAGLAALVTALFYPRMEPLPQGESPSQGSATPATPGVAQRADQEKKQEELPLPKNTVTLPPVGLAFGLYSFEYERVISPRLSFFVSPFLERNSKVSTSPGDPHQHATEGGANGGIRYFFGGDAPRGFFIQPLLELRVARRFEDLPSTPTVEDDSTTYTASAGVMGGYTLLIARVVTLSLGLGYGGEWGWKADRAGATTQVAESSFMARTNLGIAF